MRVERESKIIAMTKVGSSCGPSGQQVEKHIEFASYLCGNLGQWDILLLNFTSIGFRNFMCKKEKLKDETSKRIRETNGSQ